jgi:hypothetical protein
MVATRLVKDVLVHATIRSDSTLDNETGYALSLAASQGARVTAFLSEVEPRSAPFGPPDNIQGGIRTRIEVSRAEGRTDSISHSRDGR